VSTPRIEHIAVDIKSAVDAVTVANGFNQDLVAVRPRRNDFSDVTPENGKVLIWQSDEDKPGPEDQAYSTTEWMQPFLLIAFVLDSDSESASIDTRLNQVRADLQKKLREDVTRGGYAIDTELLPSRTFDDGKGFSGIAVAFGVSYRVNEDDPYTAG
jgi:hypothetical protein